MPGFAWVTLATNDSYSLGALVLAHSLRRVGTKYEIAVLITPGVTQSMREKLSSVFNVVQEVNVLDSKDEANLALLARPELGITFTKLHCWRLTQYDKCVFLDADTLVVKNCDELFEREELSAAPDVGWPDCFNSGVFVFKPSQQTFASIAAFAASKGSFDGGDQGLLNMYFSDWAHKDISKHLPFIYNVCSTATYSYLPAFKQYGEDVRIIHFIGVAKPWLQYFDTLTGIVQPPPGANHLQPLLQIWWNIFCDNVHPTLSDAMAGIAGALAKLTLGEPRSAEQVTLEEHMRKQGWEQGQIDYLGRDSFDNIWKKICTTLDQPDERQSSPAKDVAESETATEVSEKSQTVQEQVTKVDQTTAQPQPPQQDIEQLTASSEEARSEISADPLPSEKSEIPLAPQEKSVIAIQSESNEETSPVVAVPDKGEEIPPVVSSMLTETGGSQVTCSLQTSTQVATLPLSAPSAAEKTEGPTTVCPEKIEVASEEKCELPVVVSSEKCQILAAPVQEQADTPLATPDVCQVVEAAISEVSQVLPSIQPLIPPVTPAEESKTDIDTSAAVPSSDIKTDASKPSPVPIQVAESVLASEPKGLEMPISASAPSEVQPSQEQQSAVQQIAEQSAQDQAIVTPENSAKVTKQLSEEATSEAKPKTVRRKVSKKNTSTESDSAKEDDGSAKKEKKKSAKITKKSSKDEEGTSTTSTSAESGEPPIPPKRKSKGPKKNDS